MKAPANPLPALLSAILFLLGALLLFGGGLIMGMTAVASLALGRGVNAEQTIFLVAFAFEGILLSIAAFYSIQKYLQRSSMDEKISLSISNQWMVILGLVAGGSLLIGYRVGGSQTADWLLLPVLTIPAIVLPLVAILQLGTRRLPLGTRWQTWSSLGLAMTLTPFLLLVVEGVLGILLLVLIVLYIMTQPQLLSELQGLSQQIMIAGPESEAARALVFPLLMRPGVLISALIYVAVLVPAAEEIVKPLGVWLFARQLDSPAQGFALGALSGAGYALIETAGVSGQQTAEWASLLLSRIGTGLLHITTSALMGAAIVLAWRERRFLRLVGTYILAVLLHGLWNAFAILFTFSSLAEFFDQPSDLSRFQPAILIAMAILATALFLILAASHRNVRAAIPAVVLPTEGEKPDVSQGL